MATAVLDKKQKEIIDEIPPINDFSNFYFYAIKSKQDNEYIKILDTVIGLNDNVLSHWLNITPRTFRNYKKTTSWFLKTS